MIVWKENQLYNCCNTIRQDKPQTQGTSITVASLIQEEFLAIPHVILPLHYNEHMRSV